MLLSIPKPIPRYSSRDIITALICIHICHTLDDKKIMYGLHSRLCLTNIRQSSQSLPLDEYPRC